MNAFLFAGAAVLIAALWLAAYRLPFADPRRRQRVRLAIASWTGVQPRYVFAILGTLIYLLLGAAATWALAWVSGRLGTFDFTRMLSWHLSGEAAARTLLAGIGASSLTAFAMSLWHALPGRRSQRRAVPDEVTDVRWIQEILALPSQWRWPIPMISAALEEFYFRGVILFGLLAVGTPVWAALAFTATLFTVGQMALTQTRGQATVLGISSVVLSVVCGLLTMVEASVLPAILIHASFAGYYTNLSARRSTGGEPTPVRRPG